MSCTANLQNYLSDNMEMIRKRSLKYTFPGKSYVDILNDFGLPTLKERLDCLCERYSNKMKVRSHKLNHLLPDKRQIDYDIKHTNKFALPITRMNKYRNSLAINTIIILHMQRHLLW